METLDSEKIRQIIKEHKSLKGQNLKDADLTREDPENFDLSGSNLA